MKLALITGADPRTAQVVNAETGEPVEGLMGFDLSAGLDPHTSVLTIKVRVNTQTPKPTSEATESTPEATTKPESLSEKVARLKETHGPQLAYHFLIYELLKPHCEMCNENLKAAHHTAKIWTEHMRLLFPDRPCISAPMRFVLFIESLCDRMDDHHKEQLPMAYYRRLRDEVLRAPPATSAPLPSKGSKSTSKKQPIGKRSRRK